MCLPLGMPVLPLVNDSVPTLSGATSTCTRLSSVTDPSTSPCTRNTHSSIGQAWCAEQTRPHLRVAQRPATQPPIVLHGQGRHLAAHIQLVRDIIAHTLGQHACTAKHHQRSWLCHLQ